MGNGDQHNMSQPPIIYAGPTISPEVPFEVRRHLQLIYQKLGNHTQAFSLLAQKAGSASTTTQNIVEGTSGGGGAVTPSSLGFPLNNQTGVTSYSIVSGDNEALIVVSDVSPIAISLVAQTPPFSVFIANQGALGAGTVTLTPFPSGTISYAGNPGAASMPLLPTYCALVVYDGTNWWAWTEPIVPSSFGAVTSEWLNSYNASTGAFTATQPAFSDVSGMVAASQLPNPTTSALGGVEAVSAILHQWVNSINTSGVPQLSQPAFADISGTPSTTQVPVQSLTTTGTGAATLGAGVLNVPTPILPLTGATASMGGSVMTVGQTITATATVTGATTTMVAVCSPQSYPGAGFVWDAYISSANTVTARLTCVLAGTPTGSIYSVRVLE